MKYIPAFLIIVLLSALGCNGCGGTDTVDTTDVADTKYVEKQPFTFDENQAFAYIKKQLDFGFRIPGTPAHKACADWLLSELAAHCDTAFLIKNTAMAPGNKQVPVYNVMGKINPKATRRLLLAAHWDSRPVANEDTINKDKPILAADDGASGVGILLELARQLKSQKIDLGVDFVFFDTEDMGNETGGYCLGSEKWANWAIQNGYRAQGGILLDMVGAKGARFAQEGNSVQINGMLTNRVWKIAEELGYGEFFPMETSHGFIDDHLKVSEIAKIDMIDICNHSNSNPKTFGNHWHTHRDNLDIIDVKTLKAVGKTLAAVIVNY